MDYEDALDRRLKHREAHLERAKKGIAEGAILSVGAILGNDGRMIGSTLHVDFPDRECLEKHLREDPYISGRVWDWEKIEIRPARFVPVK